MNNLSKRKAIQKWLESQPRKTERDWLLEERCESEEQRQLVLNILSLCEEQDISIAPYICLHGDFSRQFVKKGYHRKYFNILDPDFCNDEKMVMLYMSIHGGYTSAKFGPQTPTKIQFDFSLFGKYYFNIGESIEKQSIPSVQWKKYLIGKLGDMPTSDAEDIASLLIKSNHRFMDNTPLYDLESPEFMKILEEKTQGKNSVISSGLDKIPSANFIPNRAKVNYTISSDLHQLTLGEFIEKLMSPSIYKGGRLIIAFINKNNDCLFFPDEAAGVVNKYGEIYSGYYEEFGVVCPEMIDFTNIIKRYEFTQPIVACTKRYGTIPVLDIVPFEWDGYAFNAIVVDKVNVNGRLSNVSDWLV